MRLDSTGFSQIGLPCSNRKLGHDWFSQAMSRLPGYGFRRTDEGVSASSRRFPTSWQTAQTAAGATGSGGSFVVGVSAQAMRAIRLASCHGHHHPRLARQHPRQSGVAGLAFRRQVQRTTIMGLADRCGGLTLALMPTSIFVPSRPCAAGRMLEALVAQPGLSLRSRARSGRCCAIVDATGSWIGIAQIESWDDRRRSSSAAPWSSDPGARGRACPASGRRSSHRGLQSDITPAKRFPSSSTGAGRDDYVFDQGLLRLRQTGQTWALPSGSYAAVTPPEEELARNALIV